jgi:CelD/BcsL family acetyltransferase involved in cellulose biosynthesis
MVVDTGSPERGSPLPPSAVSTPLEVETVTTLARFDELREEWGQLLGASASDGFFLTWEWLHTWWKHLAGGRQLSILSVRSGGKLIAIAPLAVRPRRLSRLVPFRAVEFLGTGSVGSNYLDLIVRRGHEPEALEALAGRLGRVRLELEFVQVRSESSVAAGLAEDLGRSGWTATRGQGQVCPFRTLRGPNGAELDVDGLDRRLKELKKRFEVRFEQVTTEPQRREALSTLVRLHGMRWQDRECPEEAFHTPELLAFHEELSRLALERGWLRLLLLLVNGEPAASLYGFRYGGTFYFYQSGFDPKYGKYSVGLITLGLTIRLAIEEGAEEFDLLAGDEQYKFRWAKEVRELAQFALYPPGWRGLVRRRVMAVCRAGRKTARRILPRDLLARVTSPRSGAEIPHAASAG